MLKSEIIANHRVGIQSPEEVSSLPSRPEPRTEIRPLRLPDPVRAPTTETRANAEARGPSSQVAARAEVSVPRRRGRVRQPRLRVQTVHALNRAERSAFAETLNILQEAMQPLVTSQRDVAEVAPQVPFALKAGLKAARVPKADQRVADLGATKMDRFLVALLGQGSLSLKAAKDERDRLDGLLRSRTVAPDVIKHAIVAFDALAQRLALATEPARTFVYEPDKNQGRDLLVTFARALHR